MDASDVGDEDLLRGAQAGRDHDLEQLVRRHAPALHRLAAAILGDDSLADDVVQETWLAALRGADGFEGRSSVRTWLLSICANRARTCLRRERRVLPFTAAWRDERGAMLDATTFTPAGAWSRPVTAWDDHPFDTARGQELRRQLAHEVDRLPPRQRQVVVARDVLGRGSAEVASMLGITANNQRVLLHHARATLRAALADVATGPTPP